MSGKANVTDLNAPKPESAEFLKIPPLSSPQGPLRICLQRPTAHRLIVQQDLDLAGQPRHGPAIRLKDLIMRYATSLVSILATTGAVLAEERETSQAVCYYSDTGVFEDTELSFPVDGVPATYSHSRMDSPDGYIYQFYVPLRGGNWDCPSNLNVVGDVNPNWD